MKQYFYFLCLFIVLTACNKDKENAETMLKQAEGFYESKEYASAKIMLDSLKKVYPKEVKTLRNGLQLMRKVELEEQERNLAYCDSMFIVCQSKADSLKKNFIFEKDKEYDDIGKFVTKQQKSENIVEKSYIRCGVDELGEMYIASVYYGNKSINHIKIKVSDKTGNYTETESIPKDGGLNYSFQNLGMTTEIVTYSKGKDSGVIQFICNNYKENLKVEYLGSKTPYSIQMSQADKTAIVEINELATILSDIEHLKKETLKIKTRIEYLKSKK